MKSNQIGFLYPKQSVYKQGLWIIEPDMIHPDYKGHLRIHVLNMGKEKKLLHIGDPILELLIYENKESFSDFPGDEKSYEETKKECLRNELNYPSSFLGIKNNLEEVEKMFFPKLLKRIAAAATIVGLFIAGAMLGLTAHSYFKLDTLVNEAINLEKIDWSRDLDKLKERIDSMERNVKQVQEPSEKSSKKSSP